MKFKVNSIGLQFSYVPDTSRLVDMLNKVINFDDLCLNLFWNMSQIKKMPEREKGVTNTS